MLTFAGVLSKRIESDASLSWSSPFVWATVWAFASELGVDLSQISWFDTPKVRYISKSKKTKK